MSARKEKRVMPPETMGGGVVRFMAEAEGWVMIRRPGCMPFVATANEWNSWPVLDSAKAGK